MRYGLGGGGEDIVVVVLVEAGSEDSGAAAIPKAGSIIRLGIDIKLELTSKERAP